MSQRKLPEFFNQTMHEYRVDKRRALRKCIKVVWHDLLGGTAYAPTTNDGKSVLDILNDLQELKVNWSQKAWGK